jgi:predicted RNase H-like HicB family nuclease
MSLRHTYKVTAEREGEFWIVRVPELDAVVTQARRFADVKKNAREAIAVWLDKPLSEIEVAVNPVIPPAVQKALDEARQLRKEANERFDLAAEAASDAARRLTKDLGLTLREAAEILGVSFQRVAQLVDERSRRRTSASSRPRRGGKIGV